MTSATPEPQAEVREFAPDVFLVEGPRIRMLTIPFSTRMTVVRRAGGELWLHSPVELTRARAAAVDELGRVAHIVAPGTFHHLAVDAWKARYPEATVWAEASLVRRFGRERFDRVLERESPWDDIAFHAFTGSWFFSELVFLHRPSDTLIVTDVLQNHDPREEIWFWRQVKRINAILAPGGGVPRDFRLTVRDRASARASVEAILEWEFERVVLTHGLTIESGGHAYVRDAFAWLLGPVR